MTNYPKEDEINHNLCAQNIRYLRMLHELPQRYLAQKLGISQVAYCRIEKGEIKASKQVQIKLSDLYGCHESVLGKADIREVLVEKIRNLRIESDSDKAGNPCD